MLSARCHLFTFNKSLLGTYNGTDIVQGGPTVVNKRNMVPAPSVIEVVKEYGRHCRLIHCSWFTFSLWNASIL